MSKMNTVFAAILLAAMTAVVPSASATTSKAQVVISGSSAAWQAMGLAAYSGGSCAGLVVAPHPPCKHYTENTKFNLNDTRPTNVGGTTNVDPGDLWIVWDSPTGTQTRNVWVFLKVDSIVGARCFYANPKCNITVPSGYTWSTLGNKISSALWGGDSVPPADVTALFGPGVTVNTAATDIRPEDALFETCRVNSTLGNGVVNGGFGDGLDGLGYGANSPGDCPAFGADLAHLVGSPIKSGTSTSTANPLAFNITGHDPFTNSTVSAGTVLNIGAAPVVFIESKTAQLSGVTDATGAQLQDVFSGTNCNGNEFAGGSAGGINVYLREPLSGTMTTAEMSVFRRPTKTKPPQAVLGTSQETGVGATNPLANTPCAGGGGTRTRGIGTGEVVGDVKSASGTGTDGIAYTFFSFGNVSSISNSGNWGYLTLDGVDPLGIDLGPNNTTNQQLPNCTAPCPEGNFWSGDSFPGLRSGNYTAWQELRLVTSAATNAKDLLNASYTHVVNDTPDYIPTVATGSDPGVTIWHSHYQQRNGDEATLGAAPSNGTFTGGNPPVTANDHGGEAGGCTLQISAITGTTYKKNYIQSDVTEVGGSSNATCALDRD